MSAPGTPTPEECRESYPDKEGGSFVNAGECGSVIGADFLSARARPGAILDSIACSDFDLADDASVTGTVSLDKAHNTLATLVVTLTSSDVGKATVPTSVTFNRGDVSKTFTVTGVAAGATTLTAAHSGMTSKTHALTVSDSS
jgi:hypothetical protein